MREPAFWRAVEGRESAPLARLLLTPVSALYSLGGALRLRNATPVRAGAPVICIGNATLGGAGKTPIARAALARLRASGVDAHALSRGHGGRLQGPLQVDPAAHSFTDVGDEPLLLAREAPAWIARDRPAGAQAAVAAGAQAIVMDDGFQNPSLAKDLSILVIDAVDPFGNGRVFPAGPLREPLPRALARADAVILTTPGPDFAPDLRRCGLQSFVRPILRAWLELAAAPPAGPLVAFAGIGRPQKFFDTLAAAGAELADSVPFPDHHPYTQADLDWLTQLAAERGAALITTEKDHVRLPAAMQARAAPFAVTARLSDEAAFAALLSAAMDARREGG